MSWTGSLIWAAPRRNLDAFRHALERLDRSAYLAGGYFCRWLNATALILVEKLGAEEFGEEDEWLAATLTAQMILNYKNRILIQLINDVTKS